jgi:hypothetical protein
MKKEVSDHLARVFLETKVPEKIEDKEPNEKSFLFFVIVSVVVVASLIFSIGFFNQPAAHRARSASQVVSIAKHDGPYVLKYNFKDTPSKIETLSIAMSGMDLKGYSRMRFAIRMKEAKNKNIGYIKVSLSNARRESSSIYLSDIRQSWKTVELSLRDFSNIYDWACLERLSFSLEAWNLVPLTGELLIDGVEFIKN